MIATRATVTFALITILSVSAAAAHGVSETPVEKVITLLEDLKTQVETEGKSEKESYNKFACFCKDTTETKSTAITDGQDKIDSDSATIEEKTATKLEKEAELEDRKKKQEKLQLELKDLTVQYRKDEAEYEAVSADLDKAISSLEKAIEALESSKPAALIALRETIKNTLALGEALALIDESKTKPISSFLQQKKVDPDDPEYKFKSQPIIDLCQKLLGEFQDKKAAVDAEWAKTKKTYEDTKADLEKQLDANKKAMDDLESDIETLKTEIADARKDLIEAEAMMKDDQKYIEDLTERCEVRAKDWDQRASMRAGEIEAVDQALAILTDKVKKLADEVNERSLMQVPSKVSNATKQATPAKAAEVAKLKNALSFLQGPSVIHSTQRKGSFLARLQSESSETQRAHKALALLANEGQRINSAMLTSLSSQLAADPFVKVKKLIQNLIERLLAEATAEASKKGFCDTEVGKAKKDRDYRFDETKKISQSMKELEVKKEELDEEITTLGEAINTTTEDLKTATDDRNTTKHENLATIKEAKEGLVAVQEAITILKSFYKQAAKATVFAQASPVDEDTEGAGFSGAYKGQQDSAVGIIGLLETIKSDFERTIKTTKDEEKTQAADFVKFDRTSKSDLSGKSTKKELDAKDLETTNNTLAQKMEDLKSAQKLLDSALEEIEALKPMCIDTGMSYAERVEKREEEIDALKKAVCILDTDGVEAEC